MKNISSKTIKIGIALLLVYIVWGSTYLGIRFAVETIPPFLMAGMRQLCAGLLLYGFRRIKGDQRPNLIQWRATAIIGSLLLLGGNGLVSWAEQNIPSSIAALLVGSSPLWMVLIDALPIFKSKTKSRPGILALVGLFGGFIGIAFLVSPANIHNLTENVEPVGAGILIFASILWSLGSVYSRNAQLPLSSLLGTGMEMICGGIGLLLAGTFLGEWKLFNVAAITPQSWLAMVYLIVFGSLVGFVAYSWLLRNTSITIASTYAYVNPMVAIFLGNLLANEPLTLKMIISAILIIGSVALISLKPKPAPPVEIQS